MAQVAMARHQVPRPSELAGAVGSPLFSTASNIGPVEMLPNPDFVFPLPSAEEHVPRAASRRPISLQVPPTGRQMVGATQRKSVSALPDFSFNPSASDQSQSLRPSPPHSPARHTPNSPSRGFGHRRGGSEFIGGDGKVGGVGLMSTSPSNGDGVLPAPNSTLRPGPPAGRRGHAHRRSGAISAHDIPKILQKTKSSSDESSHSPASPTSSSNATGSPARPAIEITPQPSPTQLTSEQGMFPDDMDSSPSRPLSRARVGFSERVEYIRPLSTISSETESSMSTIRGHSVSNSLTSVISSGATSPPPACIGRPNLSRTVEEDASSSRPSTAGAILDMKEKPKHRSKEHLQRKRPVSTGAEMALSLNLTGGLSSPALPPKRKSWLRFDHLRSESSHKLPISLSEPTLQVPPGITPPISPCTVDGVEHSCDYFQKRPPTPPRKSHKTPRKVKSWANTIISRKTKGHPDQKKDAGTDESVAPTDASVDLDALDLNSATLFDDDNTVTLVTPPAYVTNHPVLNTSISQWKPKPSSTDPGDMSPVIDLDAALDPLVYSRGHGRGKSVTRRTLHSGGGLGIGLYNHRRAESAPALAKFEGRSSALAGVSQMTDVFEEEEEEDEEANRPVHGTGSAPEPLQRKSADDVPRTGLYAAEGQGKSSPLNCQWNFMEASRNVQGRRGRPLIRDVSPSEEAFDPRDVTPVPRSRDPVGLGARGPVEVVEAYEEPRTSSVSRCTESAGTATTPTHVTKLPQPMMDMALPLPSNAYLTPDTLSGSSFSSPDFRQTQDVFDYQDHSRLQTATSSVADGRSAWVFGEPGPDLPFRLSVDGTHGTPSLTSSRSTMTNAPHTTHMFSSRNGGDRSSSVSSTPSMASVRRRKRSSIVSLSRLMEVSNHFGSQRSKLHIEQRPQSEHMNIPKENKSKKSKRLSKLMQFWKSKDSKSSSSKP